jgi:hypothetical protein
MGSFDIVDAVEGSACFATLTLGLAWIYPSYPLEIPLLFVVTLVVTLAVYIKEKSDAR